MRDIRRVVNFLLVESSDDTAPAVAQVELLYRRADPFAVAMNFTNGRRWRFARDLLADGLDSPVGDGDVLIRPVGAAPGRVVEVTLRSPDGRAVLQFDRTDVALFLRAAFKAVPRGREHEQIDWDTAIAALLPNGDLR